MKPRTTKQKNADNYQAYQCLTQGKPVKRTGAKDGSKPVHPVCPVDPDKTEDEVLKDCLAWLTKQRIFHDRHDVGGANIAGAGFAVYGIKGAGDIIGINRNGLHFEIETKRGKGGRWKEDQQKRCEEVRATKGIYLLISGVEELIFYDRTYCYFSKFPF